MDDNQLVLRRHSDVLPVAEGFRFSYTSSMNFYINPLETENALENISEMLFRYLYRSNDHLTVSWKKRSFNVQNIHFCIWLNFFNKISLKPL